MILFLFIFFFLLKIPNKNCAKCSYKPEDCNSCDISISSSVSLTCSLSNKTVNYQLFETVPALNYTIYSSISIINKNYTILPGFIFSNFKISVLNLAFNEIESISVETFSAIKSLETLDLSNNKLKSIDNLILSFNKLLSLKYLDLANNQIEALNLSFTPAFANLIKLNLTSNKISFVALDAFKNTKNLLELNLNKNTALLNNSSFF